MRIEKRTSKRILTVIATLVVAVLLCVPSFAYTSSNSAITVYNLSRFKSSARYDSTGERLITAYTIPSSYIKWYVIANTTGGSQSLTYRNAIYDSTVYGSIPERWFSVWNWYSTSSTPYNRFDFSSLTSGTNVVITLNLTVNPYNTSGGKLGADLLFVDNEAAVSQYARFGYMTNNSNHSPVNPAYTVTDSYSSPSLNMGSQQVIVQLSFVMDNQLHDGLFPVIIFYDSNYTPYYGITINSADISVTENVPLTVANNIVINDINNTVNDIQQGVEDVNQGVSDVNQGVSDLNDSISGLEDTLTNNPIIPSQPVDVLPSENYEQADGDIDTAFNSLSDIFDYISGTFDWFPQMWNTLLDGGGGLSVFYLLPGAAAFLIIRALLGR